MTEPAVTPTLTLWTFAEADVDLIRDMDAGDIADGVLSQCFTAWRTSEAARAAVEAEVRWQWDDEAGAFPVPVLAWVDDGPDAWGDAMWRLEVEEIETTYLVHAVHVLD